MEELNKLRKFYLLKNVERANRVKNRKESSAEHTWSCLMLADYFLTKMGEKGKNLDRLKIYELLMYHDVVEIEAGDIPIHHTERRKNKTENEKKALAKLKEQIPVELKNKFVSLFEEFEEERTEEAKFAQAIDKLDAQIHELDYKKDWKGWDEQMVRKFFEKPIVQFPEIKKTFEKLLQYVNEQGYFRQ